MNEGMDLPEIEVVGGERFEEEVDIPGQIAALKSQREALELQYVEGNQSRIDALSRQIADLEARL
jgi:polyhydroxyalkanoate synthesis regulator phasin